MKSHTVKSNAKRAARKLAERFPEVVPIEPLKRDDGLWLAAANVTGGISEALAGAAWESVSLFSDDSKADAPAKEEPAPSAPEPVKVTAEDIASLPPRKASTPEEVKARRAERRERLEKEKTEGKRAPDGSKIKPKTKAALIVEMASREGGATLEAICDATGWQRHTLRGFVGGTLRKAGHDIQLVREPGAPSRYVIPPKEEEAAEEAKA